MIGQPIRYDIFIIKKNNFPDWGAYDPSWKFRRPEVNNATGLPFNNKTNYQDTLGDKNKHKPN